MNESINGKELFSFLQKRFKMTEKEALNNMKKHRFNTGLIEAELNIKKHTKNVFNPLIQKMRGK